MHTTATGDVLEGVEASEAAGAVELDMVVVVAWIGLRRLRAWFGGWL
jgi:molybdenum cofactor biosynthesis enzyme MoaA